MARPRIGAVSFKVTARLGKGEQVKVSGDAPFLGCGDPEQALPLYTTPADYPLWFSQEDLPKFHGNKTGYRYCVFRGGRFYRWEAVKQVRVLHPSSYPQIPRDILDDEPTEDKVGDKSFQQKRPHESKKGESKECGNDHHEHKEDSGGNQVEDSQVVAVLQSGGGVSAFSSGQHRCLSPDNNDHNTPAEAATASSSGHIYRPSGGVEAEAIEQAELNPAKRVAISYKSITVSPPLIRTESKKEETNVSFPSSSPSSSSPSSAGTSSKNTTKEEEAAIEHGDGVEASPGGNPIATSPADSDEERDGGDAFTSENDLTTNSLVGGLVEEGICFRRPPALEPEEEESGGLGLGLGLGVDAMSSPPPISSSGRALQLQEQGKVPPHFWRRSLGGVVVASFFLPVTLTKRTDVVSSDADGQETADVWTAEWDNEQLVALQTTLRVVRVGTIKFDGDIQDEDRGAVVKALSKLNCFPVFLSKSLVHRCYYKYCKGVLWPILHNMLEMYDSLPNSLIDDKTADGWQAYKEVNRAFRDKIVEVFHDGDVIWVHGFHLAILPAFLDRTVKVARIGLFLHTPFPPSELFRTLPQRGDILRGMLGADQVGFHRYIDSQHFMSSCRRILGLRHLYSQETGLVQIVNGSKPVILINRHAGVDPDAVKASLQRSACIAEASRLRDMHGDKMVVGGVERVERLKGVWLKLQAFGSMLEKNPDLVGRVSMHEVGISNPARGEDYRANQQVVSSAVAALNDAYGEGTVVYEEREAKDITLTQRAALMSVSSVFVKTPVHDGLSTTPLEYRIVQDLTTKSSEEPHEDPNEDLNKDAQMATQLLKHPVPGVLIMSDAVSCCMALKGGFSVNPWKVEDVGDAIKIALTADPDMKTNWHEEDVEWCKSYTTAVWAEDILGVLSTVPKETRSRYATTGLGLTSRVVGTDPTFRRLDTACARKAYSASKSRVFFLDYGGTLVKDTQPTGGLKKGSSPRNRFMEQRSKGAKLCPEPAVVEVLSSLCRDPLNVVFVVSGREKDELQEAFGHIEGLGLAAEHGSFYRWPSTAGVSRNIRFRAKAAGKGEAEGKGQEGEEWNALHPGLMNTAWKDVTRRFMRDFQIHTHGSYVEEKGTAMLWHYGDADPEFGVMQAKQLQDELTDVLCSPSTPIPSSGVVEASGAGLVLGLGPGHGHGHVVGQLGEEGGGLSCPTRCSSSKSIASEAVTGSDAIEITHEEGLNSEAGGGGAYLEVRRRGANKGSFVHMVLSTLGWPSEEDGLLEGTGNCSPASGRFCLCVGDDVSDEDMFIAVKSYESVPTPCPEYHEEESCAGGGGAAPSPPATIRAKLLSSGKQNLNHPAYAAVGGGSSQYQPREKQGLRQQQREKHQAWCLTATVGSKPSDASAWLPGVDAVVSLLRTLARESFSRNLAKQSKSFTHGIFSVPNTHLLESRGGHSMSPTRPLRAFSAGTPGAASRDFGEGYDGATDRDVSELGTGVPVVRRHSYSMGGKPKVPLSLGEFLRVVSQPEPEPPMF